MRVIAGTARGLPLRAPKSEATRPTSDKARGAIFSMLAAMDATFGRVLDLYAGTGALAIEALSRGADEAVLIERNPGACAVIRDNLARTGFARVATVVQGEVERALARQDGVFDMVFLDPPYADERAPVVLEALATASLIGRESVVVYEHSRRTPPPPVCGPLALRVTRRHGDTCITIYAEGGAACPPPSIPDASTP